MSSFILRHLRRNPGPLAGVLVIVTAIGVFGSRLGLTPLKTVIMIGAILCIIGLLIMWFSRVRVVERSKEAKKENKESAAPEADELVSAEITELQVKMASALAFLNKRLEHPASSKGVLKRFPIYAVIGPSESGKSELLGHADLKIPFGAPFEPTSKSASSSNCDIWVTEEALIFDTKGRYAIHEQPGVDSKMWSGFLTRLRRWRKKLPLNGLIVAVPIAGNNGLVNISESDSSRLAKDLRTRIQELIEVLRIDVPVYLVFTKLDSLKGSRELFSEMPADKLREVVGMTFGFFDPQQATAALNFNDLLNSIGASFRRILLSALGRHDHANESQHSAYLFTEEFRVASPTMSAFIREMFRPSNLAYQPRLRGVYFTSADSGGSMSKLEWRGSSPIARFTLGRAADREPSRAPGRFVHDLFHSVILKDRELSGSLKRRLPFYGRVQILLLVAALVFTTAAVWNIAGRFSRSSRLFGSVEEVTNSLGESRNPVDAIHHLDSLHQMLVAMEQSKESGLRFGKSGILLSGRKSHDAIQAAYYTLLRRRVLTMTLDSLSLQTIGGTWPLDEIGKDRVRTIDLLTTPLRPDSNQVTFIASQAGTALGISGKSQTETVKQLDNELMYYWRVDQPPLTLEPPLDSIMAFFVSSIGLDSLMTIVNNQISRCPSSLGPNTRTSLSQQYNAAMELTGNEGWRRAFPEVRDLDSALAFKLGDLEWTMGHDINQLKETLDAVLSECMSKDNMAAVIKAAEDTLKQLEIRRTEFSERHSLCEGIEWVNTTRNHFSYHLNLCRQGQPDPTYMTVYILPSVPDAVILVDGKIRSSGQRFATRRGQRVIQARRPGGPFFVTEVVLMTGADHPETVELPELSQLDSMTFRFGIGRGSTAPPGSRLKIMMNDVSFDRPADHLDDLVGELAFGVWKIEADVHYPSPEEKRVSVDSIIVHSEEPSYHKMYEDGDFVNLDRNDLRRSARFSITFHWDD